MSNWNELVGKSLEEATEKINADIPHAKLLVFK